MTPEQIQTISATVRAVEADPHTFATRFYERLFELDPEVRALFAEDMSEQMGKLVEEIVFLADAATDLDGFTARAHDLGARHRRYGVRTSHYPTVERALLGAMADVLGSGFGAAEEAAWRTLYHLVAETMVEGASGSLFTPTG